MNDGLIGARIRWPGPPAPRSSELQRAAELAERNRRARADWEWRTWERELAQARRARAGR